MLLRSQVIVSDDRTGTDGKRNHADHRMTTAGTKNLLLMSTPAIQYAKDNYWNIAICWSTLIWANAAEWHPTVHLPRSCPCDVTCAVLQVWCRCDSHPAVTCFHTFGCSATIRCRPTPTPPHPHAATRETTGHRAGASLRGSEWDSQPDQYLCISCPFAQVSSLIITARWSFNELAGRAEGRAGVTFPHAWAELDHLQRHGDRTRQHRWHYSHLCCVESNTLKAIFKMLPAVSIGRSG